MPTPGRTVAFQKPTGSDTPAPATAPAVPQAPPAKPIPPGTAAEVPVAPPPAAQPPPLGREKLFRLESDLEVRNRIVRELVEEDAIRAKRENKEPSRASYFEPPVIAPNAEGKTYQTKVVRETYPVMKSLLEPDYVVHRRLLFEDKNTERYGWDLGILQPVLSTALFYKDTLLWPANLASHAFERYDTSAGKYLAGTPVPYYLYPPEIDLFGFGVGGAVIAGVAVILP